MPKARARKHTARYSSTTVQHVRQDMAALSSTTTRRRKTATSRSKSVETLLMPSLVAIGCWGLAFSFIFLTSDANHYLYGGMAVIMALMWTVMVGMRISRMRQERQNVNK